MMTNLFSIFDPSTNIFNLSLNWTSTLIGLLIIPYSFWIIPNRQFILWNFIINKLHNEFKTLLGPNSFNGSSFIFVSLFSFILFNNFLGLFPYIFTSTSHLTISLSLSLSLWLSFMFYGWINNSQHMFIHMIPQGTPSILMPFMVLIETISNIIRLLFYTLFASLPMLMGIFFIFYEFNCMIFYYLKFFNMNFFLLYLSMILAFLVKMPMYFVHLWLPKAHVEAPVSGSMILAGIMLKLGGYGLLRIMIFFQSIAMKFNFIWIIISLVGGFYISLNCLCQVDIKSLIAYSSVAHMSLVICGIMSMNYWGFMGSYIMMIGHGLCSSGMFCLANINYERLHSRSLYINKGLMNFMPSLSLWWFLLMSSNMAAPPSLNLMGEMSLINSMVSWSYLTMFMLIMISFFSAVYSLYLYSFTQHGKYNMGMYSFYTGVSREYLLLMLHWLPLNILVLKIDFVMVWF